MLLPSISLSFFSEVAAIILGWLVKNLYELFVVSKRVSFLGKAYVAYKYPFPFPSGSIQYA